MNRLIVSLVTLVVHLTGWSFVSVAEDLAQEDVVMITDITPDEMTSGEEVKVTFRVAYRLVSRESGAISLSANSRIHNGYSRIASTAIEKGAGEITLTAIFVPRYWSDAVSFGVNAALLVPVGDDFRTKALSVDQVKLNVKPANSKVAEGLSSAESDIWVDGVTITSILPDIFEMGLEQEIIVKLKYELLSRAEAEIVLSVSGDKAATLRPIGSTKVEIGKGETEIRANFVALKTAGLPIGRLLVSLSELPRSKRAAALAWDQAIIGVE